MTWTFSNGLGLSRDQSLARTASTHGMLIPKIRVPAGSSLVTPLMVPKHEVEDNDSGNDGNQLGAPVDETIFRKWHQTAKSPALGLTVTIEEIEKQMKQRP